MSTAIGLMVAALGGVLVALHQLGLAVALVALLALIVVTQRSPRGVLALGLLVPLLPVLRGIPVAVTLAGKSLYFSDLLLPAGLGLALLELHRESPRQRVGSHVAPYAVALGLAAVIGIAHQAPVSFLLRDLRGPAYVLLAYVSTVKLGVDRDGRRLAHVLAAVLWATAALVVLESVSGLQLLAGRVETVDRVEAALSGTGLGATRFLVAPKDLAVLVCCAAAALLLRGTGQGMWRRFGVALLLPSVTLVFFAFSRRALLAVGVAVVFAVLVSNLSRIVVRGLVVLPVTALCLVVISLLPVSQDSYVARQASAFSSRVVNGLSGTARAQDKGIAFRQLEGTYAVASVQSSPAVGHGLGATYRPNVPGQPFFGTERAYGRTYVHDFYLWLAVKLGVLGVGAFALFVLTPIASVARRARRDDSDELVLALAAGVAGLCAVNVVSPVFNEPATAVVLGCALGIVELHRRRGESAAVDTGRIS